jgi:predicted nuclease of predicted toxin-antitoxin system
MKLKLDENLSRHLKPELIELGHDVLTAANEHLLSRPDTEIARAARHESRMLLTLDIEFADLRKYPPGSHPGVILFRPLSLSQLFRERLCRRLYPPHGPRETRRLHCRR